MERKLRYLEREIRKDGIPVLDTGENPEAPMPREMIDLEVKWFTFFSLMLVKSFTFSRYNMTECRVKWLDNIFQS